MDQLRTLGDLALGLCFAASQVDRGGGTSKQLAEPLRNAYALREILLTAAIALAKAGVIPAREVEKIQEGRGALDAAQDCVDLAALFRKYTKQVQGKTAVTAEQVTTAAKLGTDLLKQLRPAAAKRDRKPAGALKDAIEMRNRMATLVSVRHERLRRVAGWFWGDAAAEYVPLLQARMVKRSKKAASETKKPT